VITGTYRFACAIARPCFEDPGGRTKYTARVHHWSVADREAHEKMGFHEGWGLRTEQLEALARQTLTPRRGAPCKEDE